MNAPKVVRVVMAIGRFERRQCHSKKGGSLPWVRPLLHEPRRTGMPEGVGDDMPLKPHISDQIAEGLVHSLDWLAQPFDGVTRAKPLPASQVREE